MKNSSFDSNPIRSPVYRIFRDKSLIGLFCRLVQLVPTKRTLQINYGRRKQLTRLEERPLPITIRLGSVLLIFVTCPG